ncbi:MAG: phage virion morphogenesis protein [Pseudomonadota bacterium]|nr:phage virion morphogenesis protein [Pseudomonadota bacterium]
MISVDFKTRKAIERFNKLNKKVDNANPVMKIIAAKAWREVIENFDKQQTPDGKKWKGWKYKGKRVNYRPYGKGGSKLLEDTGTLKASTRHKALENTAIIYNNKEYANYQNKMRKFLGLGDEKVRMLRKLFLSWVIK